MPTPENKPMTAEEHEAENQNLLDKLSELRPDDVGTIAPKSGPVDPMKVRSEPIFACTVGDVIRACDANPNHPIAKIWKPANERLDHSTRLVVERADMKALLENKKVVVDETIEEVNGTKSVVKRKRLIDFPTDEKPVVPVRSTKKTSTQTAAKPSSPEKS